MHGFHVHVDKKWWKGAPKTKFN